MTRKTLLVLLAALLLSCAGEDKSRPLSGNAFTSEDDSARERDTRSTDTQLPDMSRQDVASHDTTHDELADLPLPDVRTPDASEDAAVNDTTSDEPDPRPEALLGYIGSPCETDRDCGYEGGFCLPETLGYPEGMCSHACDRYCPDAEGYPTTFCIASGEGSPACHSRCDYIAYPGYGCRQGYSCDIRPRYNDPGTSLGSCVPAPDGPAEPLSDCLQWLIDEGIAFEPTEYPPRSPSGRPDLLCDVHDPVRLISPVRGVNFRYMDHDPGDFRSMLMSCELARALTYTADILREHDITEMEHMGTTVCRVINGTDRISQHGLGTAIDIGGFWDADSRWYGVYDHWEHGTDTPRTVEGRLLYEIAHELHDAWIFNVILTPEYNSAHDNHFHVDLTEGSHFLGSHDLTWSPHMGPNIHGD